MQSIAIAALTLGAGAYAQQAGTLTTETHPKLSVSKCSAGGTCTSQQQSIVLDANWRWLHSTSGATNCYDGNTWNSALCPDGTTCAKNCALDGADYSGVYGVKASGNSLSLQLVTGTNSGSRVYLMDSSDSKYEAFNLLNQEFTFDVDVSKLPCGLNGALYFVQMDADGGVSKQTNNKAGAKYGTGYCDAQCPKDIKFVGGKANVEGWTPSSNSANTGTGGSGICCSEMDIWEANSISSAYTPHPCQPEGYTACTGSTCTSTCDQAGCDFNSWRMGNESYYGPGALLDTKQKMTVVTQFITTDGTSSGDLKEIKRFYVQNGVTYANSQSNIDGVSGNSLTDSFCAAQKTAFDDSNTFKSYGGMKAMGESFKAGMVLVMSIWDDYAVNMLWLDSDYPLTADPSKPGVSRGPCSTDSGKPADVEKNSPGSTVVFSNIKTGPIGSTFNSAGTGGGNNGGGGSGTTTSKTSTSTTKTGTSTSKTTTTTSKTSTTTTTSSTPATSCSPKYGQCGGKEWKGPFCCQSGSTCKANGEYYSQCL